MKKKLQNPDPNLIPGESRDARALKQLITAACRAQRDDSKLLPVHDKSFTQCSQIISSISRRGARRAPGEALPSSLLPPLP